MTTAVRDALWRVDPSQAIWAARPMTDLLRDWVRQRRFNTALLVAFAAITLSLAGVGVYRLMSFSVEQRVNELGIRRALGGGTQDIFKIVLGRALLLASLGVGLGLLGSVALTRFLRGMLFDVGHFDPITFSAGVCVCCLRRPTRRVCASQARGGCRSDGRAAIGVIADSPQSPELSTFSRSKGNEAGPWLHVPSIDAPSSDNVPKYSPWIAGRSIITS